MVTPPCAGDCSISLFVFQEGARRRSSGKIPSSWYSIKQKDRTECGNYMGISLVAHAGQILLKIIACRLSEYCERVRILPEERSGSRSNRSTTNMTLFVIRRLQKLARKYKFGCMYALSTFTKAYDSVDRTLLWTVLARFGVPQNMI